MTDNTIKNAFPLGERGASTVIITGASGSVGEAATLAMAKDGWHVIMACRNLEKGKAVMDRVKAQLANDPAYSSGHSSQRFSAGPSLELKELELSSYDSIKAFAASLQGRRIDALFNNAGIMCRRYGLTDEGIERTMAVNYLGTVRLTELIIPLMPAGCSNIVNMVSLTARFGRLSLDWRNWDEKRFGQLSTYAASKRAVLNYSISLARRHPEIHINVSDPGIVNSNMITMDRWYDPLADIFFRPFISTPEQGAVSAIRAISATGSMHYYVGHKDKPIAKRYLKSPLVDQMWEQLQKDYL